MACPALDFKKFNCASCSDWVWRRADGATAPDRYLADLGIVETTGPANRMLAINTDCGRKGQTLELGDARPLRCAEPLGAFHP